MDLVTGLTRNPSRPHALGFLAHFFASERGDQHDGRLLLERLVALDVAAGLQAVHAGHAPVHEDDVEGLRGVLRLDGGDGFGPGCHHLDEFSDGAERLLEDLPRRGVVIHHQHAQVREPLGDNLARALRGADLQPDREEEGAAHPGLAFEPDAPAHQLDQPPADGQPQPGAAVLAGRGRVGLHEWLEELGRLLAGHADAGVAHRELELHLLARAFEQFDVQPDLAALGELDRVVDEVREDLAKAERVAQQMLGNRRRDMGQELQPLVVRLLGGKRRDRADHLVEPEIGRLHVELARLDLGEVQDVVDDAQQGRAGVVDFADVIALLGR